MFRIELNSVSHRRTIENQHSMARDNSENEIVHSAHKVPSVLSAQRMRHEQLLLSMGAFPETAEKTLLTVLTLLTVPLRLVAPSSAAKVLWFGFKAFEGRNRGECDRGAQICVSTVSPSAMRGIHLYPAMSRKHSVRLPPGGRICG